MSDDALFPLEYQGKIIDCQSAEDRELLQSAILLDGYTPDRNSYPSAELVKMSTVCERYGLSGLQSLTLELAKQRDEQERP